MRRMKINKDSSIKILALPLLFSLAVLLFAVPVYSLSQNALVRIEMPQKAGGTSSVYAFVEKMQQTGRFIFCDTSADYVMRVAANKGNMSVVVLNEKQGIIVKIYNFTLSKNYTLDNAVSAITSDFAKKEKKIMRIIDDRIIIENEGSAMYPGEIFQLNETIDELRNTAGKSLGFYKKIRALFYVEDLEKKYVVLKMYENKHYDIKEGDYIIAR